MDSFHNQKTTILKQINILLLKIFDKTKGNVAEYDSLTKEVSEAVDNYKKNKKMPNEIKWKTWSDEQRNLFLEYKKLIKLI